jgi:hypothetical protein
MFLLTIVFVGCETSPGCAGALADSSTFFSSVPAARVNKEAVEGS